MEYFLNIKKTCRCRNPLLWFLTLFVIVSSQSSQPKKGLPEPPTLLSLKHNGSMANLSWTNSGHLEEKIRNYTIIYCYPCSNCTTTGRVDGINGNASTYKLHLPVNNTCYEIKMISCTLSSCGMYSDSITQDIKAGLAVRHGNGSGETTTSNDQTMRFQPSFYASVSFGILLLVSCAIISCYFCRCRRKNKTDSSHSSPEMKVCCTAEVRVSCGTVTASEEDTSSSNSNSMTESHVNSGAALDKTDTRSKDTITIDITEDHGDCGTESDEPAKSVQKPHNHAAEDNKSTRVFKSERKTITKAQIHKNKNRQKFLDMDSLDGLMYKAKEVHSPSNEKEKCKEAKEEMKREDLMQEIMHGKRKGKPQNDPDHKIRVSSGNQELPKMRPRAMTKAKMIKLSHRMTILDLDSLAGLMDIRYDEREAIKMDSNFPDTSSKANKVLCMINEKCDRKEELLQCLDEMGLADIKDMIEEEDSGDDSVKDQVEHPVDKYDRTSSHDDNQKPHDESPVIHTSKLTPREMHRLSRRVAENWYMLAGYLGIQEPDVKDIQFSNIYPLQTSKAEKALHLYNISRNFNRKSLASYLGEMHLLSAKEEVDTGSLRHL